MSRWPPRVFISYTHDSEDQLGRVLGLSERLRQGGIDARVDQYEQAPAEGWPRWMESEIEHADFVLVVCTATYLRRFRGEEDPDRGLGATWEGGVITIELYESQGTNQKFVPILWSEDDRPFIPRPLRHTTYYLVKNQHSYDELYARLRGQPIVYKSDLGPINEIRSRSALLDFGNGEDQPKFADAETAQLSHELDELYELREQQIIANENTLDSDRRILEIRQRLRKGPQLRAGEYLQDGRFKLVEAIGEGGFATVWKAYDRELKQLVAIKVLHGQHSENRDRRDRFFRGAQAMKTLNHKNIVRVIDGKLEDEGWHYFVMEYLSGSDFERAVLHRLVSDEQKIDIVIQVAEALDYAHQSGVIHRDVKPSNILLDEDLEPKLTDFDLVLATDVTRFTGTSSIVGSLPFIAPEALQSAREVGPAADVYSLASTALFALIGKTLPSDYYRNTQSTVDLLSDSEKIKKVFLAATALDIKERYQSVRGFAAALKAAAEDRELPPIETNRLIPKTHGIPSERLPQTWLPRISAVAMTLSFAVMGGALYRSTQQAELGMEPRSELEKRILIPDRKRTVRGAGGIIDLPPGKENYLLSLPLLDQPSFPDYRLDIVDLDNLDAPPLWQTTRLQRLPDDSFDLFLPGAFLTRRRVQLRLWGIRNGEERMLATYSVDF